VVTAGQEFEVVVTFSSPDDQFNSIGLNDAAPAGWLTTVDAAWVSPSPLEAHSPAPDEAEIFWYGNFAKDTAFTVMYKVEVPANAEEGIYHFSGVLEYYIAGSNYVATITGAHEVEVREGAIIEGQTREVDCEMLAGVTVKAYLNGVEIASTVSDGDGNYSLVVPEFGDYELEASKDGFRNWTKTDIEVTEPTTYTVDFIGDHGLIPNAPTMSYVLKCMNLRLYGEPPCQLSMSKVLAVMNARLYPIDMD